MRGCLPWYGLRIFLVTTSLSSGIPTTQLQKNRQFSVYDLSEHQTARNTPRTARRLPNIPTLSHNLNPPPARTAALFVLVAVVDAVLVGQTPSVMGPEPWFGLVVLVVGVIVRSNVVEYMDSRLEISRDTSSPRDDTSATRDDT